MVTKSNRAFGRVTIKRLLARMCIENGNYEHYLHFLDYDSWLNRMRIINAIERSEFYLALEYEGRRDKYSLWKDKWEMYNRFVSYIDKAPYGKLAKVKVYPKLVVCMYTDIYI